MAALSNANLSHRYIFKIRSSRLRRAKWDLTLPLEEARRNDEIIALADSQVLRWIDELNGVSDSSERAAECRQEINTLRKQESSTENRREIRRLYKQLDKLQFKPDYMSLIIERNKDYHRASKGFTINGVRYKRLLGTNGGIKKSTIVFVSERLHPELSRRIDNGRRMDKKLVTAKLEAYKSLSCSASTPVSFPAGVLVVPDVQTSFKADYHYLTDEVEGEPIMELMRDKEVTLDATDGFGLMLPSLARRWSSDLGLPYTSCGFNTRFSFEKGMVFAFDYIKFAEEVAGTYMVKDSWGNDVDIRSVEIVLTESMVKLWDSYESCDDYINTSKDNGYTFSITKSCPEKLENERALNYQFIQSYDLSDEDIEVLTKPTIDMIKDVLGGDWRKTALFLHGTGMDKHTVEALPNSFSKAILVDQRMLDDPYVQSNVYSLIRNRINQAKVGVLDVHGNYSIVSGDPYLLCQGIFGLELTGLLSSGEIYNGYWAEQEAEELACFRAPMTSHSNIRKVRPVNNESVREWYQHINTATIFNGWDTSCMALNGMDKRKHCPLSW